MNYFAHGHRFLDDPYFLAGTAVPDWLSLIDRRMRVRARRAQLFLGQADRRVAGLAAGIARHHHDDDWFHRTRAFAELSLQLTVAVRDTLPPDDGMRPSFLGHILVELLLDAALIADDPSRLDDYYRALASVDPQVIERAVNRMATRSSRKVAPLIPRFCAERFLYDYLEDAKLLARLNRVMRRVRLPLLPDSLLDILPDARGAVAQRRGELYADVAPTAHQLGEPS